jgi:hypothetical protein
MGRRILQAIVLGASWTQAISAQNSGVSEPAKAAIEVARATLAKKLNLDAATIEVLSTEARTWPNSGLGCSPRGSQTLQVVVSGYEVNLKTERGNYRVHATDKRAVVCQQAAVVLNPRKVGPSLRNLDDEIASARMDLADKLKIPESRIRTQNFTAVEWPDSTMDCAVVGESIVNRPSKGYIIALRYQDRVYTYHTDMRRVRACPAIELE